MKTSKKTVENVFRYFIKELGGKVAERFDDHEAYSLDYTATYGGYVIEQIDEKSSGVWHPFGNERCSAAELVTKMHFAMEVLRLKKQEVSQ